MASLIDDPNGRRRIQFVDGQGNRRAIRLGKIDRKAAESILTKIEAILASKIAGFPMDRDTANWLTNTINEAFYAKLVAVGLVDARAQADGHTLKDLLDRVFSGLTVKQGTATAYGHARRNLLRFFKPQCLIESITPLQGDQFRSSLVDQGLSTATVSRRIVTTRYIFKQAMRWGWIERNPFDGVKTGSQRNPSRLAYIRRDTIGKVMDACPDAQWRLLVALSRYGGLRCPSEHLALKWSDILWDQDRIRVPSPKTEHIAGNDCRIIPLFPELRQPLLDVFHEAEDGAEYVITRYRQASANLRTQFKRIIHRAGVAPWPKLWHNLRASRETELANEFPIQTVCQWIGNSVDVAKEHYLQVTDEHYDRAVGKAEKKAAQNPAQYTAELGGSKGKVDFVDKSISDDITDAYRDLPTLTDTEHGRGWIRTNEGRAIRFTV